MHKSDNEPALLAIKASATARMPEVEVVDKSSPVGDHQANGAIEVAVRELKRQMRALRMSLEYKLGRSLDNGHPLVGFRALQQRQSMSSERTAPERRPTRRSLGVDGPGHLWSLAKGSILERPRKRMDVWIGKQWLFLFASSGIMHVQMQ